jgi:hypothetical protein
VILKSRVRSPIGPEDIVGSVHASVSRSNFFIAKFLQKTVLTDGAERNGVSLYGTPASRARAPSLPRTARVP